MNDHLATALTATRSWPDPVDEILASDQALALGRVTPARGVVLTPLTNTGLRSGRTLTPVTSSIGAAKKLLRIEENPQVALAYHSRRHGGSDRPEFVLIQGRASHTPFDDRGWIERNLAAWEHFAGLRRVGTIWERWLRIYHWRVAMTVEIERVIVWPHLLCRGAPEIYGRALPASPPPPQSPPKKGTGARLSARRAARRAGRLANRLLGWVGQDGFPMIVPVEIVDAGAGGIVLSSPAGLPSGARRAGLLAHEFARYTYGQKQRRYSGWLEVADGWGRFAPHTQSGYYLPESRFLYRLAAGFVTRRGFRSLTKAGLLDPEPGR